ncbi:uncharacterized protein A4U43_C04F14700 [Asparagus officinalis]|uniref:K-box domain-containing protein n=2 Tax=Asparagus officinalis TaxID=4686 RepID=A0A5P1F5K9_ASPOF|nr:uncharacterized protein A4U43_C04F14700 [Asparagus officinalis]
MQSHQQYLQLKGRVEDLQRWQRNILGEDLGSLSCKDLDQLEKQLDTTLKHIRSTRTQITIDQLSDLQRKEKMLSEANKDLWCKREEGKHATHQVWATGANVQSQGHEFFQALQLQPTLEIGFESDQIAGPSASTYLPPRWLARDRLDFCSPSPENEIGEVRYML